MACIFTHELSNVFGEFIASKYDRITDRPIMADDKPLLTHFGLRHTTYSFCWSHRHLKAPNSAAPKRKSGFGNIVCICKHQHQRNKMDYGDYVVDESTALATSQQTVESRGGSGAESWNEISANRTECDAFELFEVHRRSANRYLSQYFDCLARLPKSGPELNESDMSQGTCNQNTCT